MEELSKPENDEVFNEALKYEVDKINRMEWEISDEHRERINFFEEVYDIEFIKTIKSIKHILKQRGLILPKDWKEVFYSWYVLEKLEDDKKYLSFPELTLKLSDRDLYFEWAEKHTNKENEKKDNKINYRSKSLAVRYLLLGIFFKESQELINLKSEKKIEQILAYILDAHPRTAKGLKNNEPKYIKVNHEDQVKKLIDKIKKGDFL